MGRNALYAVIRMPGRHSKSFTTTASRQDDVQKKLSFSRFFCVGMLVPLVAMSGLSAHSDTNVRKDISASRAILESWEANGASSEDSRITKSREILTLARKWEVHGVAIGEHGSNLICQPSSRRLASWFHNKTRVKANEEWNKWQGKNGGNCLQGGTGLLAFRNCEIWSRVKTKTFAS